MAGKVWVWGSVLGLVSSPAWAQDVSATDSTLAHNSTLADPFLGATATIGSSLVVGNVSVNATVGFGPTCNTTSSNNEPKSFGLSLEHNGTTVELFSEGDFDASDFSSPVTVEFHFDDVVLGAVNTSNTGAFSSVGSFTSVSGYSGESLFFYSNGVLADATYSGGAYTSVDGYLCDDALGDWDLIVTGDGGGGGATSGSASSPSP